MSFAFASYNKYGIVISSDRCITGTAANGEKYRATSSCRKLFLTSQGYGITFTGCSSVDGVPVPVKILDVLSKLNGDMAITELFSQFVIKMSEFTSENIIFIAAGYKDGEPHIFSATTQNPEIVPFSNLCYSGESDLGKKLICAVPIAYSDMTLQDRIDFHRFITYCIAKLQSYSGRYPTVSEQCDIAAISQDGVLFSQFSELH